MIWLNNIILFAFCRQTNNPEQLKRTAKEQRDFYKAQMRKKK